MMNKPMCPICGDGALHTRKHPEIEGLTQAFCKVCGFEE
jgi:hypothetical protein